MIQVKNIFFSGTEQILSKKFFDQMHSLDCDEMDILWPNDSIILTFYDISVDR